MAEALIDSLSDEQLDPGRYRDVHRETLTALIDAKATGRTLTQEGEPGVASVDLLAALRASIEAAKQRRSTADNGGRRRSATSTGAAKKKQRKPTQAERGANAPKKRG
jgi:DNA end-binding protein Ku